MQHDQVLSFVPLDTLVAMANQGGCSAFFLFLIRDVLRQRSLNMNEGIRTYRFEIQMKRIREVRMKWWVFRSRPQTQKQTSSQTNRRTNAQTDNPADA